MRHRHGKRSPAKTLTPAIRRIPVPISSGIAGGGDGPAQQAGALNDHGAMLAGMGRMEEALAGFDAALALAPDHVDALNNRGLLLGMLGRHEEALLSLDCAARFAPQRFDLLCNRGYSFNELGRHEEALACLDRAATMDPAHFGAQNNRALALAGLGRYEDAEAAFAAAIAARPGDFGAVLNRALSLDKVGRYTEALAVFDSALRARPGHPEALSGRGTVLLRLERHEEALACFDRVLEQDPDHFNAFANRALALSSLDRLDEALACAEQACSRRPDDFGGLFDLALVLARLHRYEDSLLRVERALELRPGHLDASAHRGGLLIRLHRLEAGLACLRQILDGTPEHVEALNSYGVGLWAVDRFDEARAVFEKVLQLSPGHVNTLNNLSLIDLAEGRLREGFAGQEVRWRTDALRHGRFITAAPLWQGDASLEGKVLLLTHEQGYGDTLQFVRYALLAARLARRVILAVPPGLRDVLASLPGAFDIVVEGDPVPAHDYHCPVMSLPLAFGTTLDTIPSDLVPYLAAEPARVAAWAARLGPARRPRIGLTWAGRQYLPLNIPRDMRLELLRPVLELDAEFITLQKDIPEGDRVLLDALPQLVRHGESLSDFSDTAALIANLDLVIAVDTSVVHLAGAMGKPVWLMNRYAACWRWLRQRDDSPWYPTLHQFRQAAMDDWTGVVERVREALADYLGRWNAADSRPVSAAAPQALPQFLANDAGDSAALMEQGLAAARSGDYESALGCFTRILTGEPDHLGALHNLASTLAGAGFNDEALVCLDKALTLEPDNADVQCNRGLVLGRLERFEEALDCFDRLASISPPRADILNGRGLALANLERHAESLACFEQTLALTPEDLGVIRNRGLALGKLHRFEEALLCFWRILAVQPGDAGTLLNRGIMLDKLGRRDEALGSFERALQYDPGLAEARCDRGLIKLGRGDFAGGFEDFESRWDAFLQNTRPATTAPQWRGQPLQGSTILLHHEQGFGDTLQFVRYVPLIARMGARVILLVPPTLHDVLNSLPCEVQLEPLLYDEPRPLPPHDYHCPMMSLPLAFGTTLDSIPATVPYLHADAARAAFWSERLGPARRPRIGLAWAGRQYAPVNYTRDMPLEALVSLLSLDADFISLQNEVPARDLPLLGQQDALARHGEAARDFADTTAIIANLDLVITVDTAIAHLAGALGKPVWILNRYAACWRWLGRRSDSPWYPTARLFHQPAMRDWASVVEEVHVELGAYLAHRRPVVAVPSVTNDERGRASSRAEPADAHSAAALLRRGLALAARGCDEEALGCLERALAAQPDSIDALFNRGWVLDRLNRRDEALACYDAVLAARPDHATARCNRAMLLLGFGDFDEGFREYECRWDTDHLLHGRQADTTPPWLGDAVLEGRTIVVHHEQGYGDALQFARYLPLLAARAGRVVLTTLPELRPVLRSLPAAIDIIVEGDPVPAHDLHIPLMSLPLAFGTTLDSIPARVPYLAADPSRAALWRARLGNNGRLRVGLVWAGRQWPLPIPTRDIALPLLLPVLDLDADFVSLQHEVAAADRGLLDSLPQLLRHGEAARDFADTAALVDSLDLIICVDTAVAHLAGALGKPVWLMNRYAPCWRWLRERSDTPWYPTLRQFRQRSPGDWDGVVRELTQALSSLIERRETPA